jgi:hypothetical protein
MRQLPKVIPVLIGIIAIDFTLVFGLEAFRILTSPISGLELPAFAHVIYGLGKIVKLGPDGLVMLATAFGAIYLAIAAMCGLYVSTRIQALRGGRISHDLLDAALILVVISTLLAATPAMLQGVTEFLIHQRLPLWLVGLAATLSMIERLPEMDETKPAAFWERTLTRVLTPRQHDETTFVAPAIREKEQPARWSELRGDAGMKEHVELMSDGAPGFALHGR